MSEQEKDLNHSLCLYEKQQRRAVKQARRAWFILLTVSYYVHIMNIFCQKFKCSYCLTDYDIMTQSLK